eukprot:5921369-Prymnesium_polylepis.1
MDMDMDMVGTIAQDAPFQLLRLAPDRVHLAPAHVLLLSLKLELLGTLNVVRVVAHVEVHLRRSFDPFDLLREVFQILFELLLHTGASQLQGLHRLYKVCESWLRSAYGDKAQS